MIPAVMASVRIETVASKQAGVSSAADGYAMSATSAQN